MARLRSTRVLAALLALALSSAAVRAQEPDESYEALLEQAVSASANRRYLEARELFTRAHALAPSARTRGALGIVAVALADYTAAKRDLEAALQSQVLPLSAEQRLEVSGILEWMQSSLATLTLRCTPQDAEIELDGKRGAGTELLLEPGVHYLAVFAPGFDRRQQIVTLGVAERVELLVTLTKTSAVASAPPFIAGPASPRPLPPMAATQSAALWPWLGGAGVVAVGAGAVLGVLAANDFSTVEDAKRGARLSELHTAHDRAPWLSGAGIALGAAGIVALVFAGVDLFGESAAPEQAGLTWALGPSHLAVEGRF
jgi:hypothetical protein